MGAKTATGEDNMGWDNALNLGNFEIAARKFKVRIIFDFDKLELRESKINVHLMYIINNIPPMNRVMLLLMIVEAVILFNIHCR